MGTENTVKLAIKAMGIEDTTPTDNGENKNPIQQMQIQTYDAVKQCGKLGHYGYYGNAPKNSLVVVIQANGQEECLYACVLSHFSCVQLFATPWTVALQAPLSMGILQARMDWSGLPCPPPGDHPNPGIEPMSLRSPALADGFFNTRATREALNSIQLSCVCSGMSDCL